MLSINLDAVVKKATTESKPEFLRMTREDMQAAVHEVLSSTMSDKQFDDLRRLGFVRIKDDLRTNNTRGYSQQYGASWWKTVIPQFEVRCNCGRCLPVGSIYAQYKNGKFCAVVNSPDGIHPCHVNAVKDGKEILVAWEDLTGDQQAEALKHFVKRYTPKPRS